MRICKFSATDSGYCETHACRIDTIDVSSEPVELNGGRDILVGAAARVYRQALRHAQSIPFGTITQGER